MARRSNPLALAVLTLLDERPMHPYEMSTTLKERHKGDSIRLNYGSLYSIVEALRRGGLIDAQETSREGRRPERTVYAITPAGRVEVVDWLSDLVSTPRKEFTHFQAALSLIGALPPNEALRLLELRLHHLELTVQSRRAVRASVGDFPEIFMIEDDFELALLDAETAYVRRLVARIRSGELGGLDGWRRLHELRAKNLTPDEIDDALDREFPRSFMTSTRPETPAADPAGFEAPTDHEHPADPKRSRSD
jgi:DNA-binding PadR family transcriptional regulator